MTRRRLAILLPIFLIASLQSHGDTQEAQAKSYPVLSGVGCVLREKEGHNFVTKVLPGSPADRSKQIGEGDRLVAVEINGDETSLDGKTYNEAASLIRGPVGTSLLRSIKPHGNDSTIKVPLIREPLEIDGVSGANYNRLIGKPAP
jgi:carboxyl-terminal processing protease